MKRLFIIRTPLQLFNAFEAMQRFSVDSDENELLIVYGTIRDYDMMQKMLKVCDGWSRIVYQPFMGWKKQFYAFQLKNKFKKNEYIEIYTGMIYHIPLHLMNYLNTKNNWLLDDGNETRLIVQNLNSGNYDQKDHSKPGLMIKQNPQVLKNIKIFTLYHDLKTNHEVVINDYRVFKKHIKNLIVKKNTCLMIGSNLIGTYLRSEEIYLNILASFIEHMKNKTVFYAPHRYLNELLIHKIKLLGYQILEYDTILEVDQMVKGWRFEEYYSIRSTAIDTLTNLYNVQGIYVRIPSQYFVSEQKWNECNQIWKTAHNIIDL